MRDSKPAVRISNRCQSAESYQLTEISREFGSSDQKGLAQPEVGSALGSLGLVKTQAGPCCKA